MLILLSIYDLGQSWNVIALVVIKYTLGYYTRQSSVPKKFFLRLMSNIRGSALVLSLPTRGRVEIYKFLLVCSLWHETLHLPNQLFKMLQLHLVNPEIFLEPHFRERPTISRTTRPDPWWERISHNQTRYDKNEKYCSPIMTVSPFKREISMAAALRMEGIVLIVVPSSNIVDQESRTLASSLSISIVTTI